MVICYLFYTISGLEGTITGLSDESVELEIAPGVITTWLKLAVRDRVEADDDLDDLDDLDDGDVLDYEEDVVDGAYDVQSDTDQARAPKTDS